MNGTDGADPGPDAKAQATRRPDRANAAGARPAAPEATRLPAPPATLDTASLFAGRSEVRLLHRGQEYRLRVTKQGKLILTK